MRGSATMAKPTKLRASRTATSATPTPAVEEQRLRAYLQARIRSREREQIRRRLVFNPGSDEARELYRLGPRQVPIRGSFLDERAHHSELVIAPADMPSGPNAARIASAGGIAPLQAMGQGRRDLEGRQESERQMRAAMAAMRPPWW